MDLLLEILSFLLQGIVPSEFLEYEDSLAFVYPNFMLTFKQQEILYQHFETGYFCVFNKDLSHYLYTILHTLAHRRKGWLLKMVKKIYLKVRVIPTLEQLCRRKHFKMSKDNKPTEDAVSYFRSLTIPMFQFLQNANLHFPFSSAVYWQKFRDNSIYSLPILKNMF